MMLALLLIILMVSGWLCTRKPATVMRFTTLHVHENFREKGKEIARLVRTDPEEWQRRFPEQVAIIQLAGIVAYFIAGMGFLIWLLSLL